MTDNKKLAPILKDSAIAKLIMELDALGYDLEIRPKPLRSRALKDALAASLLVEEKNETRKKKGKS